MKEIIDIIQDHNLSTEQKIAGIERAIQAGQSLETANIDGASVLHIVAGTPNSDLRLAQWILEKSPALIEAKIKDHGVLEKDQGVLEYALFTDNFHIALYLINLNPSIVLDLGVSENIPLVWSFSTAIARVVELDNLALLKNLLDFLVSMNYKLITEHDACVKGFITAIQNGNLAAINIFFECISTMNETYHINYRLTQTLTARSQIKDSEVFNNIQADNFYPIVFILDFLKKSNPKTTDEFKDIITNAMTIIACLVRQGAHLDQAYNDKFSLFELIASKTDNFTKRSDFHFYIKCRQLLLTLMHTYQAEINTDEKYLLILYKYWDVGTNNPELSLLLQLQPILNEKNFNSLIENIIDKALNVIIERIHHLKSPVPSHPAGSNTFEDRIFEQLGLNITKVLTRKNADGQSLIDRHLINFCNKLTLVIIDFKLTPINNTQLARDNIDSILRALFRILFNLNHIAYDGIPLSDSAKKALFAIYTHCFFSNIARSSAFMLVINIFPDVVKKGPANFWSQVDENRIINEDFPAEHEKVWATFFFLHHYVYRESLASPLLAKVKIALMKVLELELPANSNGNFERTIYIGLRLLLDANYEKFTPAERAKLERKELMLRNILITKTSQNLNNNNNNPHERMEQFDRVPRLSELSAVTIYRNLSIVRQVPNAAVKVNMLVGVMGKAALAENLFVGKCLYKLGRLFADTNRDNNNNNNTNVVMPPNKRLKIAKG